MKLKSWQPFLPSRPNSMVRAGFCELLDSLNRLAPLSLPWVVKIHQSGHTDSRSFFHHQPEIFTSISLSPLLLYNIISTRPDVRLTRAIQEIPSLPSFLLSRPLADDDNIILKLFVSPTPLSPARHRGGLIHMNEQAWSDQMWRLSAFITAPKTPQSWPHSLQPG